MKDDMFGYAYYAPRYTYGWLYSSAYGYNEYVDNEWTTRRCEVEDYTFNHHPRMRYDNKTGQPISHEEYWELWVVYSDDYTAFPNDPAIKYDSIAYKKHMATFSTSSFRR